MTIILGRQLKYYQTRQAAEELYFSEYVMPLRGAQLSNKFGSNVMLINLELRLPFLIYYFPTIKYIGQINGVIFSDLGVTWDSKYFPFWEESSWQNSSDNGWLMSYGFGPRFKFLGLPWHIDFTWEYNPHVGTITNRKTFVRILPEF